MSKKQYTKLKNLSVNSVDLCHLGANQGAHIMLKKSIDENEDSGVSDFWKRAVSVVVKSMGIQVSDDDIAKLANDAIKKTVEDEEIRIKKSMSESLDSIMKDESLSNDKRSEMLKENITDFFEDISNLNKKWKDWEEEDEPEDGEAEREPKERKLKKSLEGEIDNMISIEKMTPEDKATYDELNKKYSIEDEPGKKVEKSAMEAEAAAKAEGKATGEMHPEVKKALDEMRLENEKIVKELVLSKLEATAKKYEAIGKKPDELALKLYEMKKSGETAYNDYVALLDEQVAISENSGLFKELGSNRSGSSSAAAQVEAQAVELMKSSPNMSRAEAIVKACDMNPELKAKYEMGQ